MILTVTAGKGGVGKSTVALNLGAELEAVVVDADLGMADLPTGRGPDLHDVLAGRATPFEAVQQVGTVSILPCGRSLSGVRAADPVALVETARTLATQYGRVVIDSPAGMRSDVGLSLLASDAFVLVTQPTRAALADALRIRELARTLETPLARVVLNRVETPDSTAIETDRLAETFGAPVSVVPESSALARAQRVGQPVRSRSPGSEASKRLSNLARILEDIEAHVEESV